MKKILITGGCGFIGSRLARSIDRSKYEVVILDSFEKQIHGEYPFLDLNSQAMIKEFRVLPYDVTNLHRIKEEILSSEIIVHLAAETGTGQSIYEISKYANTNILGTANIFHLLMNNQNILEKFIVASSRSIYGEGKYVCQSHGVVFPKTRLKEDLDNKIYEPRCPNCNRLVTSVATTEDSQINPISYYALTKLNQEQTVILFAEIMGISASALRFQNVYGPGQSLKNPYTGILSIFSNRMKQNKEINIFEDGLESRDFVYIDDVVSSIKLSIEKGNLKPNAYNIGTGIPTSVNKITNLLKTNLSSESKITIKNTYRVGDIRHNFANILLAESELGFKPTVSIEKGIENFCSWVKNQPDEEDKYESSLNEMRIRGLYK